MAQTLAERARRQSYVLHALSYFAKKHAERGHLKPGKTKIAGYVNATIGRADLHLPFSGTLTVGEDQVSASPSGPDPAQLVALALEQMTETQRSKFIKRVSSSFAQTERLPDCPSEFGEAAAALLKRLRAKKSQTRRGAVVFTPDPPAEAAAKAA